MKYCCSKNKNSHGDKIAGLTLNVNMWHADKCP